MRSAMARHPVWTGVVVVVALFLALLGARMVGAEPVRGDVAGFHQRVQTDRASYAVGETVHVTFTVCRTRPWPARTASTGGTNLLSQWRVVDAAGQVVADTSHRVLSLEGRSPAWLPGQCRRAEFEWDQHHWNRDADIEDLASADGEERPVGGVPVVGDRVPPGLYHVEAEWQTGPPDDGGSPIDVSFGPQPSVSSEPFRIDP